ncbi:hypothetical protein ACHAWF_007249 [Thalassiosira exigua]
MWRTAAPAGRSRLLHRRLRDPPPLFASVADPPLRGRLALVTTGRRSRSDMGSRSRHLGTSVKSTLFPMHVLGAGSMGLLYASAMQRACEKLGERKGDEDPVTLLMRPHHEPRLRKREAGKRLAEVNVTGLPSDDVSGNASVTKTYHVPVELIGEANPSPIRRLLLCTKANDAVPALRGGWERLASNPGEPVARVIVLSNGALAVRDAIQEDFGLGGGDGEVEIALATTTHGAHRDDEDSASAGYHVAHAGLGTTHSTDPELIRACRSIGWDAETLAERDMHVMLWRKLAVNCVINPLTAVHDVKNGALPVLERDVAREILDEVSFVAQLELSSRFVDIYSDGTVGADVDWLRSATEQLSTSSLEEYVYRVARDTSDNVSSMLQDVRAGRTTEVQCLNGYVAEVGRRHGLGGEGGEGACPKNEEMCRRVEELRS